MNVRDTLKILAEKIKDIFPKMSTADSLKDNDKKTLRSIIADIQQRLAEIYGIIQRETANDDLNLEYTEALSKYPERIKSIVNIISTIALATKTKLNIPEFLKLYGTQEFERIENVCLECYQIKTTLSEKPDATTSNTTYRMGLITELSYHDYKTGFSKSLSPGFLPGQVRGSLISNTDAYSAYTTMVTNARELLDQNFQVPQFKDRILFSYQSDNNSKILSTIKEFRNPQTLLQITTNFLAKNRSIFFKRLAELPTTITEKLPELDVNYGHKFCIKVKKVIKGISFQPSDKEKKYLDKLLSALVGNSPYKDIHNVLNEIDTMNETGYMSIFKDHMRPIRNEIVRLMKEYVSDKNEYTKHFGKSL